MDLTRMKFAWARGARIQYTNEFSNMWWSLGLAEAPYDTGVAEYRIHPDDEHLQYGPLSTALRESVTHEDDSAEYTAAHFLFARALYADAILHPWSWDSEHDYPLAKLFYAEYLADEGL